MSEQTNAVVIDVTELPKNLQNRLAEIYSSGWQCSFVSSKKDGHRQATQIAYCKDFLNDAVYGQLKQKGAGIWGFYYDPKTHPPLDLENTRLLVCDKTRNETLVEDCKKAGQFLRKFEAKMRWRRTRVYEAILNGSRGTTNYCLFESDQRWMHSTPLLSLYTILARCGRDYDGETDVVEFIKSYTSKGTNDSKYLAPGVKNGAFEAIIKKNISLFNDKIEENYNFNGMTETHNHGFQAWSNSQNENGSLLMGWKRLKTTAA